MSIAAFAVLLLFVGDGQGRSRFEGLGIAFIEAKDLFGQSLKKLIDVLAGLGAGFHEGHLVLIGCM